MSDLTVVQGDPAKIRDLEKKICNLLKAEGRYDSLAIVPLSPTMGFIGVVDQPLTRNARVLGAMVAMHLQTAPQIKGGSPGLAFLIDPVVGARTAPVKYVRLPPDHAYIELAWYADKDRLAILETYHAALKQAAALR